MDCEEFVRLSREWTGNVCIFGAGKCGSTYGYELIQMAGFKVRFYCDSYKSGQSVNNLPIYDMKYLGEYDSAILVIICIAGEEGKKVFVELKKQGLHHLFHLDGNDPRLELIEYIGLKKDDDMIRKFHAIMDDKEYLTMLFKERMGYTMDIEHPKTLNEKLQWLKIHDKNPIYTLFADKYRVRDYIADNFGDDILVPIFYATNDYRNINSENVPDEHCIIKSNCWSGDSYRVRSKSQVDWSEIQSRYEIISKSDYSWREREWWYSGIKPIFFVEKLLECQNGKIPNDYKLHFINGEFQFIYCSIDREGRNYRKIYDKHWKIMPFSWHVTREDEIIRDGPDIEQPITFNRMMEIGRAIADNIPYVRVDFYDVDGKLFFGEITISHGGGFDHFIPFEYDRIYGDKLQLSEKLI